MLDHLARCVIPSAYTLLPDAMGTREATVLLLAIALQESKARHRRQILIDGSPGPARGFWQFERAGGVVGVMTHPATHDHCSAVLNVLCYPIDPMTTYVALEHNDVLAACFARLLLWTDPSRLPLVGQAEESWAYYLRNWRPGKPHPETWRDCYVRAMNLRSA
jgi:hypothetical protein